jgi:hypothetical protein
VVSGRSTPVRPHPNHVGQEVAILQAVHAAMKGYTELWTTGSR